MGWGKLDPWGGLYPALCSALPSEGAEGIWGLITAFSWTNTG